MSLHTLCVALIVEFGIIVDSDEKFRSIAIFLFFFNTGMDKYKRTRRTR